MPGDSVTWRYDNSRSGLNSNETTLTTSNVKSTTFGKVGEFTVDGRIDGEVLYRPDINFGTDEECNLLCHREWDGVLRGCG